MYNPENDYRHKIITEMRTKALCHFFGWQGGTIHQLAKACGCDVQILLYSPLMDGSRLGHGFSAMRTCELDWRRDVLAKSNHGDWPFWRDAIAGYWADEGGLK
jgi:hypothetical protein